MISIITSLYDSERYLPSFLKNLRLFADDLARHAIDFQFIIIANDPSSEERKLNEVFSNGWIDFFEVPRESLYTSWNRGITLAKNDIIGFWNVDDIRSAEAVLDGINLIKNGAEIVYFPFLIKWYLNIFNYSFLVKKKTVYPPKFEQNEFRRSMHCGPFFLFTKELYKKVGPFDEQFKIVGDFDWCVRAAKKTDRFALSKKNAGTFRVDGGGLSSGGKPIHVVENNIVCARHGAYDKIRLADDGLATKYKSDFILHKGEYFKFND